jgi:hypothetical protein
LQVAQGLLDAISELGLGNGFALLCWPLGLRAGFEAGDLDAVRALVAVLDEHPPGHLPPLLRAERKLAAAKLTAATDPLAAGPDFIDAVAQLRASGNPFNLAHALLDYAESGATEGQLVADLVVEAEAIAAKLGCAPIAARAEARQKAAAGLESPG